MKIKNVPETYEEMRDWADEYEKRAMKPTSTTHDLAELTTSLLLYYNPPFIKAFAKRVLIAFMDDRLRNAMVYAGQPAYIHNLIYWGFAVRRVVLRNFCLPRFKRVIWAAREKNKFGKYSINFADNEVMRTFDLTNRL